MLKERGLIKDGDSIHFETVSGTLTALINESKIELDFPIPVIDFIVIQSPDLLEYLGIRRDEIISFDNFYSKVFIEIDSEMTLLNLQPDFDALKQINGRAVLITTR